MGDEAIPERNVSPGDGPCRPAPSLKAQKGCTILNLDRGEVREWLNRAVSKTVEPLRAPWVRIPPSPPFTATTEAFLTRTEFCDSVKLGLPSALVRGA